MPDPIKKITLKDKTVRYRFVLDVGRDPETDRRQQVTKTFDTKKEARAEYAKLHNDVSRGTYIRPSKKTVDQFLDEWLTTATRDVEKSTAANYRDAIRPARDRLGDLRFRISATSTSSSSSIGCSARADVAAGSPVLAYRCARHGSLSVG